MTRNQLKRKRIAKLGKKRRGLTGGDGLLPGSLAFFVTNAGTGVTVTMLEQTAVKVAGSTDAAYRWMDRAHPLLGDLTPRQAVERDRGDEALGILLNVAGV